MANGGSIKAMVAETLGTGFLLATVIGSGIMGERLAAGNTAIALLANSLATGAALIALILTFGPVSGAHFNPAVTLCDAFVGGLSWRKVPGYIVAQVAGAFLGVAAANVMFDLPVFFASHHPRQGMSQLFSEFVATFGLLSVIWGCSRRRSGAVPFAVGAYITAAYWFTASTSFANPAVTLARSASDTFAGIRFADVPGFIVAQLAGAAAATAIFKWLVPALSQANPQGMETMADSKKKLLFVCVENSNRSQMSQAFARILGGDKVETYSAGSRPSGVVNPKAIESMREIGYDLSKHESKSLDDIPDIEYDAVVTMGCGDACPFVRAKQRVDWQIPDPKHMPPEEFRQVRDLIKSKISDLLQSV